MTTPKDPQVVALWMTRDEACEALAVSPRTLNRLVKEGAVQRKQVGREGRYRPKSAPQSAPDEARHATRATPAPDGAHQGDLAPRAPPAPGAPDAWLALARDLGDAREELGREKQRGDQLQERVWKLAAHIRHLQDLIDAQDDCLDRALTCLDLKEQLDDEAY